MPARTAGGWSRPDQTGPAGIAAINASYTTPGDAIAAEPKPRLHPRLAEIYRQKVAALHEALGAEGGLEELEAIRALVEAIVLVPEDGRLAIEVKGDLAAILALGANANARREGRVPDDRLVQFKVVAGTRNHRELIPLVAVI